MNKNFKLTPKKAEKLQDRIYSKMPTGRKLKIASQLILLAKKLKESKTISRKAKSK